MFPYTLFKSFSTNYYFFCNFLPTINPIQDDGGDQKGSPTIFSPVTSTNAGISPKNFLNFNFYSFSRLV